MIETAKDVIGLLDTPDLARLFVGAVNGLDEESAGAALLRVRVVLERIADENRRYALTHNPDCHCEIIATTDEIVDKVRKALGSQPAESALPPVTFGVKVIAEQGHVHFDVFAGRTPDARGRAGRLVLRADEFEEFARRLKPEVVRYPLEEAPND